MVGKGERFTACRGLSVYEQPVFSRACSCSYSCTVVREWSVVRFKWCLYREIACVQMLAYNVCATSASDGEVVLWGAFTVCVCE